MKLKFSSKRKGKVERGILNERDGTYTFRKAKVGNKYKRWVKRNCE